MEDLTGRTIGGYQIVEKIGRGGMATVFRAYQPSLDRDVAIKVLPPYYAEQDETFLQRFKREAKAIAKLRHPNILMVMDFGEEGEIAYLVMEYVTAGTLKERMKTPLKLDQIYNLVGQVGSALQYAHHQGVIHRDIKPSNIMLPKPDWALLTDFGLATMVEGSFLTQSGMTVGTPAYMSPEQGGGERVDHRTDIYALGIMLYEMVVGEVPYTAETPMAVVVKHIVDPLPIPREKNPDIPEELQRVMLKALAKDPDDRYQQASDFTDALKKVTNAHPDWSAAEIKTVASIRTPQVEQAETRQIEDDQPVGALSEDQAVPPVVEDEVETQVEEAPDLPSIGVESEPAESQPVSESQMVTQVAETAPEEPAVDLAVEPEQDLSPEPISEPQKSSLGTDLEEEVTIASMEEFPLDQPEPKKTRRNLYIFGGIAIFLVFAFLGLVVLGNIFGENTPSNVADESSPPLAETLSGEDLDGERSGEEEIGKVADLLREGKFDQAGELVVGVLQRHPEMWERFMGLVGVQIEEGRVPEATRLLSVGLAAHPEAPAENYAGLGWLYREIGRPDQALLAFEATLKRYPHYFEAHEGLIYTAMEADRVRKEIEFLTGLREQFPEEAMVFRSLADLHRAEGNPEAAVEAINSALRLEPNHPKILVSAYHIFKEIGDRGAAKEMIDRAVEHGPDDPAVLSGAGWAYLEYRQPERSAELFERALSMEEWNGWNALGLAKALIALDEEILRVPELLQHAEVFGIEQEDARLLAVLGWTYRELEDCDNAVRVFEIAEEFAPGETDSRLGMETCQ